MPSCMVGIDAVCQHLALVAAGNHIDQQPAMGKTVEGGGHARRQAGRGEARPDREGVDGLPANRKIVMTRP